MKRDIGIFTRIIKEDSLDATFRKARELGLTYQQFNMSLVGMPSMPEVFDRNVVEYVKACAAKYELDLIAISGTFNMSEPDPVQLEKDLQSYEILCQYAAAWNIPYVNVTGGSKSPLGKFTPDPLNETKEAWEDLVRVAKRVADISEHYLVTACIKPEFCTIVDTAEKTRRLLDETGSTEFKVIFDNGNLLRDKHYPDNNAVLKEAIELLRKDIVLAHVKDFVTEDGKDRFVSPGKGVMDIPYYFSLLDQIPYIGPVIMNDVVKEEIPEAAAYLEVL